MYRFSYVENVAGKAQEVSRQLFHEIIARKQLKNICNQIVEQENLLDAATTDETRKSIQDTISKLKRQLPAFCWHAWFDQGKRKNYAAHASGLIMIDIDDVADPRELYGSLTKKIGESLKSGSDTDLKKKLENRIAGHLLLAAHVTPSTKGLRLVFALPTDKSGNLMDIVSAQAQIVKDLKLKNVDACTKDLARLSFCVPEEYFLYVDEERLFEGGLLPQPTPVETPIIAPEVEGPKATEQITGQKESHEPYPDTYDIGGKEGEAIPYSILVESLQELLGGIPAHGSRNNFIFSMAAYLRYVCNDDPEWIKAVLPTYGEANDKWARTIESACQRAQYKQMPAIVHRAIENAKSRMQYFKAETGEEGNELPPPMPRKLPKLIAHLVKNVPEVCRPAVANAVFPSLASHLKGVKFWLIDGTEKEATFMCVTMAKQSSGKSAVNKPIEYITADIVARDEIARKREQDWKDAMAQKGANKEKPKRPDDLCVQVLVSDMTNAAFVQRMKDANGRYLYTNLEELDLLKQLQTNGTKDVGKIICLCFDNGKYGQERVGTQSVTARVDLRWNWNASTTIQKGMQFFRGRLVDGTLSRINFCTIVQDKSKPFKYGKYDEEYAETLKPYITNLNLAEGHIECKEALELAHRLEEQCAEEGDLSDDDVYQDLAHRAVTIAYLKSMVLYICNDMTWSDEIAEFAEWSLDYDLWCKCHFFGAQIREEKAREHVKKMRGRQNLLELLPNSFTMKDAQDVRTLQGLEDAGCRQMINCWTFRGYIELDPTIGRYFKTDRYLKRLQQLQ